MRHFTNAFVLVVLLSSCDSGETVQPPPQMEPEKVLLDVAGTQGVGGNGGDGGPATACSLYWPVDVTMTETGEILVVDWNNNRIRRISSDGIIHSFIGSGVEGDDTTGPGPTVGLNQPVRVEIGPEGAYYVAAFYNWRVKAFEALTLECSTPVGSGKRGFRGDGGPATLAWVDLPTSVVFDRMRNMCVLDQGNTRVRKVDAQTATITTFVGGTRGSADGVGESAQFAFPGHTGFIDLGSAIEISPNGEDIYLTDTENHTIRKINIETRMVTTIAGSHVPGWEGDGGPAISAKLNYPTDLAVAINGDIYIAEAHNHVIRRIEASGIITTVAGNGSIGFSPSGTPAREAKFYQPMGIDFDDATNTLYICDMFNHQVRKVINP